MFVKEKNWCRPRAFGLISKYMCISDLFGFMYQKNSSINTVRSLRIKRIFKLKKYILLELFYFLYTFPFLILEFTQCMPFSSNKCPNKDFGFTITRQLNQLIIFKCTWANMSIIQLCARKYGYSLRSDRVKLLLYSGFLTSYYLKFPPQYSTNNNKIGLNKNMFS